MTAQPTPPPAGRDPELLGQTVVVIGGSAGIGLETARLARVAGADVVLTGRDPGRLQNAADELTPVATAAFDATDPERLDRFFQDLPRPVDHVLVTGGGPYYAPLADFDFVRAQRDVDEHLWLPMRVARAAAGRVRVPGTLIFMGGTGGRRRGIGLSLIGALTAAMPALIANLALEVAPIRVNLIAAGFVDTPLSARLLGGDLDARRDELRATLPIGRVVQPADVAALAVHVMTNTALTGATYDVDGGQQVV
jgi:NAD(P)-dependent dehydrogenase (short-subunit alcohol dehydrogenase family)